MHRTLAGTYIEPTIDGMLHLSDNKQQIVIDMPGLYKLEAQLNFNQHTGANHYLDIQVNGTMICRKMGSQNGGYGAVSTYTQLAQNDVVVFYTNHAYSTAQNFNRFTIVKL